MFFCLIALAVPVAVAFLLNLIAYPLFHAYAFIIQVAILPAGLFGGLVYLFCPSSYVWDMTGGLNLASCSLHFWYGVFFIFC